MKKLNKNDIIEIVCEKTMIAKKEVREVIDCALDLVEEALLENREVNLTNFGAFTPKVRTARVGTHPKLHSTIEIKPSKVIAFRMSKSLKAKLNG